MVKHFELAKFTEYFFLIIRGIHHQIFQSSKLFAKIFSLGLQQIGGIV